MEYIKLQAEMMHRELFAYFIRHQLVSQCWWKVGDQWCIQDITFTDDWDEKSYSKLITCLKNTVAKGSVVFGAFTNGFLKEFSSVEPDLFGKSKEYLDLSSIHVSEDIRSKGIGKELFRLSKERAKGHGARKLYISAHSSVESQAFYQAMGCVEALEYDESHIAAEPYDCQLKFLLWNEKRLWV
jgi:ribosomal protein S18 acetylase RimI-like enzyme